MDLTGFGKNRNKEGDRVVAKGMIAPMKENGEATHKVFIPFELTVNGKTYGDASKGMPIWIHGSYSIYIAGLSGTACSALF